jgi:maltose O-acetyltransferase
MSEILDSLSSENRERRSQVHDICRLFSRSPSKGNLTKLKRLFARVGSDLFVEQGFYCDYGNKISLGDRVYININCTMLDGGEIEIGDDVLIGPNVQIVTVNHPTSPSDRLRKISLIENVSIGNNVWVGAGAIILPGVSIGDNVVIGAGSVVTKNLLANHLYVGNPADMVRMLDG